MHETDTKTLIAAMRILADEIQSGDGLANAAIGEAAVRLADQDQEIEVLKEALGFADPKNILGVVREHKNK